MRVYAGQLGEADVFDVLAFYADSEHYDLRAPMREEELRKLGKELFLAGVRIDGRLAAVAWMARKPHFIHLVFREDGLMLVEEGPFGDSGGWCVRRDLQGGEFLPLLAATVVKAWFTEIHEQDAPPLWGRMMGLKDAEGEPLFWSRVGRSVTGLAYRDLLDLPFGAMEREIAARWPKGGLPLSQVPGDALAAKGKTFPPLVSAGARLSRWGIVDTAFYVPTSLNCYNRATMDSLRQGMGDIGTFFEKARARVYSALP